VGRAYTLFSASCSRAAALLVALAISLSPAAAVDAQEFESSLSYTFGGEMLFALHVGDRPLSAAALLVRELPAGTTAVSEVPLPDERTPESNLQLLRSLSQQPFSPFADVEYWWVLTMPGSTTQPPRSRVSVSGSHSGSSSAAVPVAMMRSPLRATASTVVSAGLMVTIRPLTRMRSAIMGLIFPFHSVHGPA